MQSARLVAAVAELGSLRVIHALVPMKCFYHQDRDAVGTCKSCGKGLCSECAVDLGKGLACRSRCEDDARAVIGLIEQNIKLTPRATRLVASGRSARVGASVFNLIIGAVFLLWGLAESDRLPLLIVLGVCFLVYGAFSFIQLRRFERQRQETADHDT